MKKGLITLGGLAALTVLAGCASQPQRPPLSREEADRMLLEASGPQEKQRNVNERVQKLQEATDNMFAAGMNAGMAVVIMPTINLDSQPYNFSSYRDINIYTTLSSGVTEWVNPAHPAQGFRTGNTQKLAVVGPTGSFYEAASARRRYQVYVLVPGHYDLRGAFFSTPNASKPLTTSVRPASRQIGKLTMREAMFRMDDTVTDWTNPKNTSKIVIDTYCTSARVSRGECGAWELGQPAAKTTAPVYQMRPSIPVSGLASYVHFDEPFAGFDIKPGEVLLMDGFYPEAPAATFNDADCKRSGADRIECGLRSATLTRIPASLEDFRDVANPAAAGLPKMAASLQKAQYRELKISAREAKSNSLWGQAYQTGK